MGDTVVKLLQGQYINVYTLLCSLLALLVIWAELYNNENILELIAHLLALLGLHEQGSYIHTNLTPFLGEFRTFAILAPSIIMMLSFLIARNNYQNVPASRNYISTHGATFVASLAVLVTAWDGPSWSALVFPLFIVGLTNVFEYFHSLGHHPKQERKIRIKKMNESFMQDLIFSIFAIVLVPLTVFAPDFSVVENDSEA